MKAGRNPLWNGVKEMIKTKLLRRPRSRLDREEPVTCVAAQGQTLGILQDHLDLAPLLRIRSGEPRDDPGVTSWIPSDGCLNWDPVRSTIRAIRESYRGDRFWGPMGRPCKGLRLTGSPNITWLR